MSYWQGKVVLVTGASQGLGRAVAWAAGRGGARLALAARQPAPLESLVAELEAEGIEARGVPADVTDQQDVDRLVATTLERWGRIDALIHCAGASDRGEVLATSPERFRELLELNFLGAVRCVQAAAPQLITHRGHLVLVGSLAGKSAARYLGAYPASKFAVAALAQQLRLELAHERVHVLLVAPGPLARHDAGRRYDHRAGHLPQSARQPGGGVRLPGIDVAWLAKRILWACQRRRAELVVPGRARLLFALGQLCPSLADWIVTRMTR